MRAVACRGPGALALEDVARPVPGPGDVLVAVRNCGICGSDLHWYHDQMMIPSVCPGHEIAGEVAEVGDGVAALKPGDPVALEGIASCGACRYCLAGDYQRCLAIDPNFSSAQQNLQQLQRVETPPAGARAH